MNENIDPAKADPLPEAVPEIVPTLAEAKAMFDENPGLWSVLTKEGTLLRSGELVAIVEARGT